jgi:hypothetical protein
MDLVISAQARACGKLESPVKCVVDTFSVECVVGLRASTVWCGYMPFEAIVNRDVTYQLTL